MLLAAAPAAAQTGNPAQDSAADSLARNLRSLAENPKSLHALMGAGTAALEMGDPQAAITFFARAEEQAPRDGRIKMWIGAALVQLQQPKSALRFFSDAVKMGVAEADVAKHRGLAWDISGDQARAQRDYRLALAKAPDADLRRRLALSLAISGDKEAALREIEDLLLVRDRAAERCRAMILALAGDSAGAARVVRANMPPAQAQAMTPFLARLPQLSAADRARAVHLGIFPGAAGAAPVQPPQSYAAADPALQAGAPDRSQPPLARAAPVQPAATGPAKPPARETAARSPGTSPWVWSRGTLGNTSRSSQPPATQQAKPAAKPPQQQPAPETAGAQRSESAAVTPQLPVRSVVTSARDTAPATVSPGFSIAPAKQTAPAQPSPTMSADPLVVAARSQPATPPPAPPPAPVQIAAVDPEIAALSQVVASLAEPEPAAAKPATPKPAAAKPEPKRPAPAKKPAPKKPDPAKAEPARYWVQVAGGANKAALPREFTRLKAKAPKLLGGRTAWTTPLNATNRLLVGPFKSNAEAQAFVNELAKSDLSAFSWKSEAGQKIEKLPAK